MIFLFLFDFAESDVEKVTGCQKFHQVVRVAPLVVKSRNLACFCQPCFSGGSEPCVNRPYAGTFQVHRLKPVESPEAASFDDVPAPPSPQEPTRAEVFTALQQELMQSRGNFGSFTACAQDCARRAAGYPFSFPVMQPEFLKDEVTNSQ